MEKYHRVERVVIKVGTSTLTDGGTQLSLARMVDLVRQMNVIQSAGIQVVLVSSGGIAAGRQVMAFPDLAHFMPAKQMLAAVGQPRLMAVYTQLFNLYDQKIAQVLLTREDLANRRRYLNARNTLEALLDYGIIPIINENDTIATEEIRFGDNDNLSSLVSNVLEADLLLLLTDQDGLFTTDPREDSNARLVTKIEDKNIPAGITASGSGGGSGLGTGGMQSKLQAAELARRSGAAVVIANGGVENIIPRIIIEGEALGTYFSPLGSHLESRKRFLLAGMNDAAENHLVIDEGAVEALRRGGSLLPVGVTQVKGQFSRGQTVSIVDQNSQVIAVGLCHYDAKGVQKILGQHSEVIESILGYAYGAEVVHHDNLVILTT